ncbi:MAG: type II secretion system protein [Planctomycetes bacterium]|nr:type II secretion system protein [Planctomycetota bacterium]
MIPTPRSAPPPSTPSRSRGTPGFTLVETLVTLGVIALLVALAVPVLRGARAAARGAVCLSNLRSMGAGLQQYASEHDDMLPFATRPVDVAGGSVEPLASIAAALDTPVPAASAVGVTVSEVFVCPELRTVAQCRGWSYDYTPVDLMAGWIDGPPQRGVSDFLRRDPMVVVITDSAPVRPGSRSGAPLGCRNVLTIGGSVEAGGPQHSVAPRSVRW